ncbi:hypothetical protein ACQKC9_07790 [Psychrobacter sp. NPDC078409]|uniref:hypothetical protein n=1 Tax=Psychrobacter sp. NPDC078409 TaxID=3390660 RepID=UPI003D06C73B
MIKLDIIVVEEKDVDELDKYRTQRSIDLVVENLKGIKIDLKFLSISELNSLYMQGDICLFMVVGDLLESEYLEEIKNNYIPDSKLLLQPGYSYSFSKTLRQVSKNIDIYADMACYDVLAIRYFASRHFVSQTKHFNSFLASHAHLGSAFIWSYLLYLLSDSHILMCLGDTVSFENLDSELSSRKIKNYGVWSVNPPLSDRFSYSKVLERQNINNVKVKEKMESKDREANIPLKPSSQSASLATKIIKAESVTAASALDYVETVPKKVSQHTLDEAIRHDGFVRGVNLTTARLLNRAKISVKNKQFSVRDKLAITAKDIKNTLNIK